MTKLIKYIFFLGTFFIFVVLIANFYLSEQNVILVNKSRSFNSENLNKNTKNLPLLENDTNDIIVYRNDLETYKKNKKQYTFWDLIKKK